VVTIDEVRAFAITLPRSSEAFVRGRVKFRIGRIVYLSFSRDGTVMGFAFPKEWRNALVESEPEKFSLPSQSDLRYHWVHVNLAAIDADEMRALVEDAWAFCVPKRVAEEYAGSQSYSQGFGAPASFPAQHQGKETASPYEAGNGSVVIPRLPRPALRSSSPRPALSCRPPTPWHPRTTARRVRPDPRYRDPRHDGKL